MRTQQHFKYDMIITWIWHKCGVVYLYICSMVKDRLRTLNHHKLFAYIGPARYCTWLWRGRSHAHH